MKIEHGHILFQSVVDHSGAVHDGFALAKVWCGGPIRCPHHSASLLGMLGELALAAGGTIFLDQVQEFRPAVLKPFFDVWRDMPMDARPLIISNWVTGHKVFGKWEPLVPNKHRRLDRLAEILPPVWQHHIRGEWAVHSDAEFFGEGPPDEDDTCDYLNEVSGYPVVPSTISRGDT